MRIIVGAVVVSLLTALLLFIAALNFYVVRLGTSKKNTVLGILGGVACIIMAIIVILVGVGVL